jgi:hypothetical protein
MSDTIERRAYDALARHPELAAALTLAAAVLEPAYCPTAPWHERPLESPWAQDQGQTPFGDLVNVLSHGPRDGIERALASALAAHAIADARARGVLPAELVKRVVSLSTFSPFDPTPLLDLAFGDAATACWEELGAIVRQADARCDDMTLRAEATSAALALGASEDLAARAVVSRLHVSDARLRAALGGVRTSEAGGVAPANEPPMTASLRGELLPTPRGPIATTLLALSGILFLTRGLRAFARLALGYRRPADVVIAQDSVRISTRVEMLGRVLRAREMIVPRAGLVRAQRDIRFPRVAFYAGLVALFLGSAIGMRVFTDGLSVASPQLLGLGLLIAALGAGLDFFFSSLRPSANGACRLTFVPRRGRAFSIGGVDPTAADASMLLLGKP